MVVMMMTMMMMVVVVMIVVMVVIVMMMMMLLVMMMIVMMKMLLMMMMTMMVMMMMMMVLMVLMVVVVLLLLVVMMMMIKPEASPATTITVQRKAGSGSARVRGGGSNGKKAVGEHSSVGENSTAGKGKTSLDNLVTNCCKLKDRFLLLNSKVSCALQSIESNHKEWEWADNKQNYGQLKEDHSKLLDKLNACEIDSCILHGDRKAVKMKYGPEKLQQVISKFVTLQPDIDELESTYDRMMGRHTGGASG